MSSIKGYIDLKSSEDVEDFLETLHEDEAGTIILEPQNEWNVNIMGYHKPTNRLVYDGDKVLEMFQDQGMNRDDALDYIGYNISFGDLTPVIHYEWNDLEDALEESWV